MMTRERAREIWAARGVQWTLTMTPAERAEVNALWETMPGSTSFMDAFFRILHGRTVACPTCKAAAGGLCERTDADRQWDPMDIHAARVPS